MFISEKFSQHKTEFNRFDLVENKKSPRKDIHILIKLNEWFPGEENLISGSGIDEIYLSIPNEKLFKLPNDKIIELIRCGVTHDGEGLVILCNCPKI